ncbi:hypothetical protein ASPFODRAFT_50929 [Aspergillus luchuensis CBS 106.47]|uniref:Uncharacterized protein n=1 Tax=Aspergillus luchuensis (strain CBS 106.47) TaxID=1137211 RepID=A0A1M3T5V5_ASPLC|nr:hypothetical protein ASPFODRAFT_50929 [Aspergillus luchuensis CBS 106.47]
MWLLVSLDWRTSLAWVMGLGRASVKRSFPPRRSTLGRRRTSASIGTCTLGSPALLQSATQPPFQETARSSH